MKICKTCQLWSMEKKGFCHYENRGVGQFWTCEHWLAGAPGRGIDKLKSTIPARPAPSGLPNNKGWLIIEKKHSLGIIFFYQFITLKTLRKQLQQISCMSGK